jgi:hypothetical protein
MAYFFWYDLHGYQALRLGLYHAGVAQQDVVLLIASYHQTFPLVCHAKYGQIVVVAMPSQSQISNAD